jgi:hypothetical protein
MPAMKLFIQVKPNAKQDAWLEEHDGYQKVALKAPATEGKANSALIAFLAKRFNVARSCITIVKGEKTRKKVVVIESWKL